MSGQQPGQAPDGRRHSPGHGVPSGGPSQPLGRPEQPPGEKPEKEPKSVAFREWLNTGTGLAALIVAIASLLIGGAAVSGTIFTSPKSTSSTTPGPSESKSESSSASPAPSVSLKNALLSSGEVSSAAIVQSTGTDLSQISAICGGPDSGDTAAAYETIEDQQTDTYLTEALVTWDSAVDAGKAITANRQAVDQNGGCSYTTNRETAQYTGDYAGSPPTSCLNPGQYFATGIEVTSSSFAIPYSGFVIEARCGAATIFVRVYSQSETITQQTADGYLSAAIGQLDRRT